MLKPLLEACEVVEHEIKTWSQGLLEGDQCMFAIPHLPIQMQRSRRRPLRPQIRIQARSHNFG